MNTQETIDRAVQIYLAAQAKESPIVSTTHYTLIGLVQDLAALGIDKEQFYAALDKAYKA